MTRKHLFSIMMTENLNNINEKLQFLERYVLKFGPFSDEDMKKIKQDLSRFKSEIKRRWTDSHYKEDLFLKNNDTWLDGTFVIPKVAIRTGRPHKCFSELSERSKRRKTEDLRKHTELQVLTYATQSKLGETGKRDASSVLKEILTSPKRASKYKKAFSETTQQATPSQLTSIQALSMFVEADLSRRQYEIIRNTNKKLYPCYSVIQKSKQECYPNKESYRVTETCVEIKLQSLMDHTATRLLTHIEEVLPLDEEERRSLLIMCKWGCDGAQQAQFKQKFECDSDSDANLFQSSFVPLRLICSTNDKVLWQNPTPSSPRYCRPIRIRFIKETKDVTNEEINYVKNAANDLQKTEVKLGEKTYLVKHSMMLTMVDGKVCNAATNTTSTMRCYICGLTSKDFNCLTKKGDVKPEALDFGLSILHARIRFFESILHLAYKLPVKKWQLRTENDKTTAKQKKLDIQEEFRVKMGLIVDVPKPNFVNTNDGNTSRRFFADHELSAEITGIDVNFLYRLKVILEALSSGHKIDTEKFSIYAKETAEQYVALYPWHPMTPTLHKILMHGSEIIDKALLPIGQLSEEAAEARNKHIRLYRQNFARKFSREACNMDVMNRLLLSSDPLLTGMRPIPKKKTKPFMKETIGLLLSAEPDIVHDDDASSSDMMSGYGFSDEEPWSSSS